MKKIVKFEEAKRLYETANADQRYVLESLFPELKKSEDEKIREYLIRYIDNTMKSSELKSKLLAWLEKQDESYTKRDVDDAYVEGMAFAKNELEKQGEQEYAESPKFKVGDWVINRTNATIMQIINNKDFYESVEIGGQRRIDYYNYLEWDFRLWTIQDAKDGDVLAGKIDGDNYILIFKTIKDGWIETYGHYYNTVNRFCVPSQLFCRDYKGVFYPATKEQRDLLFTKMGEAGYEWDAEKKELEKIDNEEVNGEDYGIDGLWHAQRILEKTLGSVDGYQSDDGILDHKAAITAVKKLYKQKPAWSEEDEKEYKYVLKFVDNILNNCGNKKDYERCKRYYDWLKSIKQKIKGE